MVQLPHFLSDAFDFFRFEKTDGELTQATDVFRPMSFANPTSVFIEIPIQDVMTTVFDGPMAAINLQQALWRCLTGSSTGQTVSDHQTNRDLLDVDIVNPPVIKSLGP